MLSCLVWRWDHVLMQPHMTGFTMMSHTPAVRIINYTDAVFISHQPDGKCRINTVNQHNILLAKHGEASSIFMMLQGVSVLWWKGHHNLRARLYSASLLCSRTVCYFFHLRERPALLILFTQAWSENWFFLFYLSLHITQTVVSAWQETPVLQKFQANSTTNKVFTAYPFLQNRQESRLKVLTVRCLFCCIMCHTHTDVPQLMLWNPIILLNTGRLCLAVTICLYTISNFYLLLFYCIYILNINVSLMPLLFLSFFVFSHVYVRVLLILLLLLLL